MITNMEDITLKQIKTIDAVGHVLCHDLTQIIPGVHKEAVFRKGHVVTNEDIPTLLSMGKEHLYVWEKKEGMLHEDDAALILYGLCKNENLSPSNIKEGKIDIMADIDGLLKVDVKGLYQINSLGEMMISTRHNNTPVKKGDKLAGTRIIPLVIEDYKMEKAKSLVQGSPLISLLPYKSKKVGIVTTGSEVFKGIIKDAFGPAIVDKLNEFDVTVLGQTIVDDSQEAITKAIMDFIHKGADMVFCTGGMSVDPDDTTPAAIRATGTQIVTYGAPVLPGAMFLLSYYEGSIPICGLPGCVMYSKRTIFDLLLPRLMADDKITVDEIAALGHGGLCLSCDICTYPACGFGK